MTLAIELAHKSPAALPSPAAQSAIQPECQLGDRPQHPQARASPEVGGAIAGEDSVLRKTKQKTHLSNDSSRKAE